MGTKNEKTVEGTLTELLVAHGLFAAQAKAVMTALKSSPAQEPMKGRWEDLATGYPEAMMTVLWLGVRREAVKWIDKNAPQHWARPIFAEN
jgi:hypothetical protein